MDLNSGQRPPNLKRDLANVDILILKGKFKEALPFARKLAAEHRDDPFCQVALSICYAETGSPAIALRVLHDAEKRHPESADIAFNIAHVQESLHRFELAEKYYGRALSLSPEDKKADRSQCYNGLGRSMWHQNRRDKALEMWKQAVRENPLNLAAQKNLNEYTNEYGAGKAPSRPFDDFYQFQKIQLEKYERLYGKKDDLSLEEMQRVLGGIIRTWNEQIERRKNEIDSMTAAEKAELFRKTECDYTQQADPPLVPLLPSKNPDGQKMPESRVINKRGADKKADSFDDGAFNLDASFNFLPPGGGMALIAFGVPALATYGFKEKKLKKLIEGTAVASDKDKDILTWAFDIVLAVIAAMAERGRDGETDCILDAYDIAREELDDESARYVVHDIRKLVEKTDKELRGKRRGKSKE